jgi:flagellar protein FlaG
MVGNLSSVTAAPARTPAPPEPRSSEPAANPGAALQGSGNVSARGGESLPAPTPAPPPVVDVAKAAERLNELMSNRQRSLRFQVDQSSGRTVITVINAATQEVIRQIPPEELLQLQQNLEQLGSMISTHI